MPFVDEITGARVTIERRLGWAETDAAGHNHFSSAVRWLEEAEHALWRSLGLIDYVPCVPRVHLELDYRQRVWFDQAVLVTVGVIKVGGSSCTFAYSASVVTEEGPQLASEGRYVVAYAPDSHGGSQPWPAEARRLLLGSN